MVDLRDIRANLGVVGGRVDELFAGAGEGVANVANDDALTRELGSDVLSRLLGESAAAGKVVVNHALDKVEDLVDELSKLGTIAQVMLKFDHMAQKNTPGGHFQHLS